MEADGFDENVNWRDEAKYLEQQNMVLMDKYNEVARALGFKGNGWWGDVNEQHNVVVERAKFLNDRQ